MDLHLPEATWKDRVLFLLGRRLAFRVEGDSMRPTLNDGDTVLIAQGAHVGPGDIVLARHPYKQSVKMLKRISGFDGAGRYDLIGDDPVTSTDSRTFGTVPATDLLGKVVCRLKA
jgi:nickel-type superoxide dismutase maturation protease